MKTFPFLILLFLLIVRVGHSQDEGSAVARSRFDKPNSISVGGGLSLTFGKNVGDYSKGVNFEGSFLHRLNKLVAIGGFVSRVQFNYDPAKSPTSPNEKDLYTGTESDLQISPASSQTYRDLYSIAGSYDFPHGYQLTFAGGDLSLTHVGFNLRTDLIPYSESSPVSVYILTRPFFAIAKRDEVSGTATRYLFEAYVQNGSFTYQTDDGKWYADGYKEDWGVQGGFDALKTKTNVTAGIQFGPGVEVRPGSSLTLYAQALIGYTLPVSFISTSSYPLTLQSYLSKKFPMTFRGFPSLGLQVGMGYRF